MIFRRRRRVRWMGVVAVSSTLLLACTSHPLEAPNPHPEQSEKGVYVQNPQLKLDIVFGIDNSNSMEQEQANLLRNFPVFMQELQKAIPAGSTLDAHIAVVSSDLAVPTLNVGNCMRPGGDNGIFQSQPRGACTAGPDGTYLITNAAGNNFNGTIESAFSCIANLGIGGCGFEHQLASVRRALGGDPDVGMPPENAGFLRPDARLGVIIISDEDDCSAPEGSDLFTSDTSVYGPLVSYRCNEFGHLCGGAPPPRAVVSGLTCESNETDSTHLIKVSDLVSSLRDLKPNPNMLRVAVIAGEPSPYATRPDPQTASAIAPVPSCTSSNGDAAPAVRLAKFVDSFGDGGLFESICRDDFAPAMQHIARKITEQIAPCVEGRVYDTDVAAAGIQPDCSVSENGYDELANPTPGVGVPSCASTGGAAPCWRLEAPADGACDKFPDRLAMVVDHGSTPALPNTDARWSCRVCPNATDPACVR